MSSSEPSLPSKSAASLAQCWGQRCFLLELLRDQCAALHVESLQYVRHFQVRDVLQEAFWRDVQHPQPGWGYLWADWQERSGQSKAKMGGRGSRWENSLGLAGGLVLGGRSPEGGLGNGYVASAPGEWHVAAWS